MRTLIQECAGTVPDGTCQVSDPDRLATTYRTDDCQCSYDDGKYSKFGDTGYVYSWSSSETVCSNGTDCAYRVFFRNGSIEASGQASSLNVRCTRCENGYFWNGTACQALPECSSSNTGPCFDSTSKLTWSAKSPSLTWGTSYCEEETDKGYTDWRLPTIDELRTLIQNCPGTVTGGACAISDPDHLALSDYDENDCTCSTASGYSKFGETNALWSSSSRSDDDTKVFTVYFRDALINPNASKTGATHFRCVR